MRLLVINILLFTAICLSKVSFGQHDSSLLVLSELPNKYFKEVDKKIDQYSNRITGKTEKTLIKLSRWEKKIQVALEKVNPAAAQRLFGPGRTTFSSMLAKYQSGTEIVEKSKARYDSYRDKLTTSLKYLEDKKQQLDSSFLNPLKIAIEKSKQLENNLVETDAIEKLIKERKQQLITETMRYLGKSKYLDKLNKESYYYIETLRNYKQLFSEPGKAEETAMKLMHQIPGFDKFLKQNSMLASLFGGSGNGNAASQLAGLQTRDGIQNLIQDKIAAGGTNAQAIFEKQLQAANDQINLLKSKVEKLGGTNSNMQVPDFKPNTQRSKTFRQRVEFGTNVQFGKTSKWVPNAANVGLSMGYKLNDKSIIGLGIAYKLGIGSIEKISFTHESIGFRSFIDWKLKNQFFLTGGYEMNFNAGFKNINQLKELSKWQRSCLLGFTKKYRINNKLKGNIQLLFDFLYRSHNPTTQPVVYRLGYNF